MGDATCRVQSDDKINMLVSINTSIEELFVLVLMASEAITGCDADIAYRRRPKIERPISNILQFQSYI